MNNYYYSKEHEAIIPFDKVLLVFKDKGFYSDKDKTAVAFATNVYIVLNKEEGNEFRKIYAEWLDDKDNISKQYPY